MQATNTVATATNSNLSTLTQEQLIALVERLQANKSGSGGLKVSAKGAVSLYGLMRFPITLYANQWDKLLSRSDEIRKFISENESLLSVKAE